MGTLITPREPVDSAESAGHRVRGSGTFGLQVVAGLACIGFALWGFLSVVAAAIDLLR